MKSLDIKCLSSLRCDQVWSNGSCDGADFVHVQTLGWSSLVPGQHYEGTTTQALPLIQSMPQMSKRVMAIVVVYYESLRREV